jgi:ribose transport system permease protein
MSEDGALSAVGAPAPEVDPAASSTEGAGERVVYRLRQATAFWIGVVIVALIVLFGVVTPNNVFFKPENLLTIGLNASQVMLLAVGMTYLIGAAQLDLSVGANVVLSSVVAARVMVAMGGNLDRVAAYEYENVWLAIAVGSAAGIACGLLIGLFNGLLVTRLKINSFVATLGTTGIALGIAYVVTAGANIPFLPRELQTYLGSNRVLDVVPFPLLVAVVISLVLWWIMRKTRFGLHTVAIGSSKEAAQRSGIDVERHLMRLFLMMGGLAGFASLFDLWRFATTNVQGHQTDNLAAIAAVVIGGTSLFGGLASVGGSIIATLIPGIMITGLVILQISPFYQFVIVGIILILAVYFDQRRRSRMT